MLIHLGRCDSTSTWLKDAWKRQEAAVGTMVLADEQTHGRGRADHPWASVVGNLHASMVLRTPPATLAPRAGLMLAVAAAEALCARAPALQALEIKWPNDLMWSELKCGGLLLENLGEVLVVGVGLNLAQAPLPESSFLPGRLGPREVAQSIQTAWRSVDLADERQWNATAAQFNKRSLLKQGQWIEWRDGSGQQRGRVVRLGRLGELVVRRGEEECGLWAEEVRKCRPVDPRASDGFPGE